MKFNAYAIITRCIEEGTQLGYNRAFKHTDSPTKEQIIGSIEQAIINELCEYIDFENVLECDVK